MARGRKKAHRGKKGGMKALHIAVKRGRKAARKSRKGGKRSKKG